MSIETIDASVQSGSPIHLFEFYFEGEYYRLTSNPDEISALSYTWTPANVGLGRVETTEDINKNNLDLTFPRTDTLASLYLTDQQNSVSTLTVYRGYENDGDWVAFWKGRVSNAQSSRNQITLVCESVFTSLKRPGVRGKFSKQCRHSLYGRGCNIDANDSASDAIWVEDEVTDVSADGLVLTIPAAANYSDGYFLGGMIKSDTDVYRFIRGHTGSQITISRAYVDIVSSNTARLYPGCDRSMETCSSKFNNLANFGGFPHTPENNPFNGKRLK